MTAWHVSATRLPEGDAAEEAWLTDAGWREQPEPGAEELPGRFALAGLVDAHSHVSFGPGVEGPVALDRRGAEANLDRSAGVGVAVLRDVGGDPRVVLEIRKCLAGRA